MHQLRASQDRLEATAHALERYNAHVIGPAHCTGMNVMTYLWNRFPTRCVECTVGSRFCYGERAGKELAAQRSLEEQTHGKAR